MLVSNQYYQPIKSFLYTIIFNQWLDFNVNQLIRAFLIHINVTPSRFIDFLYTLGIFNEILVTQIDASY